MYSIIEIYRDALDDNHALFKVLVYAIPVFFTINFYIQNNMEAFYICGICTGILLFALLTAGINNVRRNKDEILTFNPVLLSISLLKSCVAIIPQFIIFGAIGYFAVQYIKFPIDIANIDLIIKIIVWTLIGSIILTSYLSFAKFLSIKQAFNYKYIFESCFDVLISLLFFLPQIIIVNIIYLLPVWYLIHLLFKLPLTEWYAIAYYSILVILNVSMFADYFAQAAFEIIRGSNEDYNENVKITHLEEMQDE